VTMMYVYTTFHMPYSDNSFSITTKSKVKYKFYCNSHFEFYFLKKDDFFCNLQRK
jgi:hypothetical protein